MPKIKIFKLKNIRAFLKKIPNILGENAFLSFLGLFILSLILGIFAFYKYLNIIEEEIPEGSGKQLQFKTETYNNILQVWEEKEKKFKATDSKIYINPFVL